MSPRTSMRSLWWRVLQPPKKTTSSKTIRFVLSWTSSGPLLNLELSGTSSCPTSPSPCTSSCTLLSSRDLKLSSSKIPNSTSSLWRCSVSMISCSNSSCLLVAPISLCRISSKWIVLVETRLFYGAMLTSFHLPWWCLSLPGTSSSRVIPLPMEPAPSKRPCIQQLHSWFGPAFSTCWRSSLTPHT